MFGFFGCLTLIYPVNKTPNEHVYCFLSYTLNLCTYSFTMCKLVTPLVLGMLTSLTNGMHRSSCHNHKMIVGDGRGSDAGRRSQLRPAQQIKPSLSSSGFSFWFSGCGKALPHEQQVSCGVSANRRCSLEMKTWNFSDSSQ